MDMSRIVTHSIDTHCMVANHITKHYITNTVTYTFTHDTHTLAPLHLCTHSRNPRKAACGCTQDATTCERVKDKPSADVLT